jgi:hypothetical protein
MAIEYTVAIFNDLSGLKRSAKGAAEKTFVVTVSHEAIQDYGEPACWEKAEEKHDNGSFEPDGNIWVRAGDFT